ncbi:MAG: hypothetical protein ISQ11_16920, partial [Planctomycetes bacterium]|nr:hypothetical protein [Planctomycetota bacterium]
MKLTPQALFPFCLLGLLACSGGGADVVSPPPPGSADQGPDANDDFANGIVGEFIVVDLLSNDVAYGEASLDFSAIELTVLEEVSESVYILEGSELRFIAPIGSIPAGQVERARFGYTVEDSAGRESNLAFVTIEVAEGTPIANGDFAEVVPGEDILIDVLANDEAFGSATFLEGAISIQDPPNTGAAEVEFGQVRYSCPVTANAGLVAFQYTATDSNGKESEPAEVLIEILGGQVPPVANDDQATMLLNAVVLEVDVLANDQAFSGASLDPSSIEIVVEPLFGAVSLTPLGKLRYEIADGQAPDFDAFTYRVSDTAGLESDAAQVLIEVLDPSDAPLAVSDAGVVVAGESIELAILDNDLLGAQGTPLDPETVEVAGTPQGGVFTVDANGVMLFEAASSPSTYRDSLLYRVADQSGLLSNWAQIEISITGGSGSSASDVTLVAPNLSTTRFHPSSLTIQLEAEGGSLTPGQAEVFLNGLRVAPLALAVTSTGIEAQLELEAGLNLVRVVGRDTQGRTVDWLERLYSGEREVFVDLRDSNGKMIGGTVRFLTVGFQPVIADYPVPIGGTTISNVPPISMGIRARNANKLGAAHLSAWDLLAEIRVDDMLPPTVFNGDFSSGLEGWDLTRADDAILVDSKLEIRTVNTSQQVAKHAFIVPPTVDGQSVRQVTLRYSVRTEEPVADVVPVAYDDYWIVSLRSSSNRSDIRPETLRLLGPAAFDVAGSTQTRTVSLGVDPGELVEVDVRVQNVGGAGTNTTVVLEEVLFQPLNAELVALENQVGEDLTLLSVGPSDSFSGTMDEGSVLVRGHLIMRFAPGVIPPAVQLEVYRQDSSGPAAVAQARPALQAALQAAAATGQLETGAGADLFELSPFSAAQLSDAQGFLSMRLRVFHNGQTFEEEWPHLVFPLRSLPDDPAVRLGSERDYGLGGDGWLLSPLVDLVQAIPFLYIDDCSRMNGGDFPGRPGHEWGLT